MELIFLGRGAGFNPAEGSTSAYFIENGKLFLIDSGESVFRLLMEQKILETLSEITIFITHTHSDHTGSLGSLVLYGSMAKRIPVRIVVDENTGYASTIRTLLEIYGLTGGMYRFIDAADLSGVCSRFKSVRYIKTSHCDELLSCGILFETDRGLVFYSGDLRDPAPIREILGSGQPIDKMFVDSNDSTISLHHLSIHQLKDIIPPELRPRIFCMHFNTASCITTAQSYGFSIVTVGAVSPAIPLP